MNRILKAFNGRLVLVLFGLTVLAMLAAAAWAPFYIARSEDRGPALVALFLGLFLGCNGGVIIAGILASGARDDVALASYREGYAKCLKDHEPAPLVPVPDDIEDELLAEFAEAGAHMEGTVNQAEDVIPLAVTQR